MADFDSLPPGTFCWPELSTTDQRGAVSFYRRIFGWDVNEMPMGPTETYSMFEMRGRALGAAFSMRPEEREHGVPPHWNSYVSVTSVDEAVKRAAQLGGKVIMPPMDVMEAGRMAFIADPTGAVFAVWQPKQHIGARVLQEPGALCWTELQTRDATAAKKFYTALFGWSEKTSAYGPSTYTEFSVPGQMPGAGMMEMDANMAGVPPNWMPYFQVNDADGTRTSVEAAGGKAIVPPTDIPNVGRFAVLQDPQGAAFAIIKLARA